MRILLVPVSKTGRVVYGQKTVIPKVRTEPHFTAKALAKATKTWQGFEESETKWKQVVVGWSNKLLERIPYAEWSLRTIPAVDTYKRALKQNQGFIAPSEVKDETALEPVQVVYPHNVFSQTEALDAIKSMATVGLAHHRKQGILSVIAMPFTIPVGLIPIVPNLPFLYLVYRTWCHWEAYQGAKHLQQLIDANQLVPLSLPAVERTFDDWTGELNDREKERLSRIFFNPALDVELDRAQRQIRLAANKEAAEKHAENTAVGAEDAAENKPEKSKSG